jgi:hypothetical protein
VRAHRSYIVNLDCIAEIEPTEGGDAQIKMKDGSVVPCSRRYRDGLRGSGQYGTWSRAIPRKACYCSSRARDSLEAVN